jgi:hypothetical protein
MHRPSLGPAALVSVLIAVTGCAPIAQFSPSAAPSAAATPAPVTPAPTASPEPTPVPAPTETLTETFDASSFGDPTTVDNAYYPLIPGTRLTFEGKVNGDEGERLDHSVVMTVTDMIKVIDGVENRIVHEQDFTAGELVEAELAFWAQDDEGTVWHMGEYPEEYEEGEIVGTPAWIAGIKDDKAGIYMKATPQLGTLSYSQGWGPDVGWADRARIFETGSATCVPAGCYDKVLVTAEYNPDDLDAYQLKYYAPGVGPVRVGWAGALEKDQEVLELVTITMLKDEELAKVRQTVLDMEKRAYELNKDVYGTTEPAKPSS